MLNSSQNKANFGIKSIASHENSAEDKRTVGKFEAEGQF
jgi:hypothetical protein